MVLEFQIKDAVNSELREQVFPTFETIDATFQSVEQRFADREKAQKDVASTTASSNRSTVAAMDQLQQTVTNDNNQRASTSFHQDANVRLRFFNGKDWVEWGT